MESNISQVRFEGMLQEINQWTTHSSPVIFRSSERCDGITGRASSLVAEAYGANLSEAILQAVKTWANA